MKYKKVNILSKKGPKIPEKTLPVPDGRPNGFYGVFGGILASKSGFWTFFGGFEPFGWGFPFLAFFEKICLFWWFSSIDLYFFWHCYYF